MASRNFLGSRWRSASSEMSTGPRSASSASTSSAFKPYFDLRVSMWVHFIVLIVGIRIGEPGSGIRDPDRGIRDLEGIVRSLKSQPDAQSPKPKARTPEAEAQSPRSPKPGARSLKLTSQWVKGQNVSSV